MRRAQFVAEPQRPIGLGEMFRLGLPPALAAAISAIVSFEDLVIGSALGKGTIEVVAGTMVVLDILVVSVNALLTAPQFWCAAAAGRGDLEGAVAAYRASLRRASVAAALFAALGMVVVASGGRLIGIAHTREALEFLGIRIGGLFLLVGANHVLSLAQALKRTDLGLRMTAVIASLNAGLGALLVLGLLPLSRDAVGLGAVNLAAALAGAALLFRWTRSVRATRVTRRAGERTFHDWLSLVAPPTVSSALDYVGVLALVVVITNISGDAVVDFRLPLQVLLLGVVLIGGLNVGFRVLLTRFAATGPTTDDFVRSERRLRYAFIAFWSLVALVVIATHGMLARLIAAGNPTVAPRIEEGVWLAGFMLPLAAAAISGSGRLRALGLMRHDATANVVSVWAIEVPFAAVATALGMDGVQAAFLALGLYWVARIAFLELLYRASLDAGLRKTVTQGVAA
jgi:Na+-driven multidrug efflux pump